MGNGYQNHGYRALNAVSSGEFINFNWHAHGAYLSTKTHSGNAFSPWEISKSIASSIKDFASDTLLMQAIGDGRFNDGEGTEDDLSEGTGFEVVRNPVESLSSIAGPPIPSAAPTPSSATRIPLQPSREV